MNEQFYEKVIAKCWANPAFKQQLLADPAGTLKAEGLELPEGLKVSAVENNAEQFTFVIPARPAELTDEMLAGVVGGGPAHELPYTSEKEMAASLAEERSKYPNGRWDHVNKGWFAPMGYVP